MPKDIIDEIYDELVDSKARGNTQIHVIGASSSVAESIISPPLEGALNMFPAVAAMITEAQEEVLICLYKIYDDSYGATILLNALEELKAKADSERRSPPTKVKFLINTKGSLVTLVSPTQTQLDYPRLAYSLSKTPYFELEIGEYQFNAFDSAHAKNIICDKQSLVILSGDPVAYNTADQHSAWVEIATKCDEKNIALAAREQFVYQWNKSCVVAAREFTKSIMENVIPPMTSRDNSEPESKKVIYLGKKGYKWFWSSYFSPYKIALLKLLEKAEKSVAIMVSNLNDPDILEALNQCVMRNVVVHILLGRYHSESLESKWLAGGTNLKKMSSLYEEVDAHPNLQIRWAANQHGNLVDAGAERTIHAKAVVVDKKYVLSGSSPMDLQAQRSWEGDVVFESETRAREYLQIFNSGYVKAIPFEKTHKYSREEIREMLGRMQTPEELEHIIRHYIDNRQYEESLLRARSCSLFSTHIQNEYTRSKKIAGALIMLQSISTNSSIETVPPALKDGLLGDIYQKYQEFYLNLVANDTQLELSNLAPETPRISRNSGEG